MAVFKKNKSVNEITSDDDMFKLKEGQIDYLLLQLLDNRLHDIPRYINECTNIIIENNGLITSFFGSVIMCTFGFPFDTETDARYARNACANKLLSELNVNVKVMHGCVAGLYGNVGNSSRISYEPVIQNFSLLVEELLAMEFGQIKVDDQ